MFVSYLHANNDFAVMTGAVCYYVTELNSREEKRFYAAMWMYISEGVIKLKKFKKKDLFNCDDPVK